MGDETSPQVLVELFSRFREHLPPDARGKATVTLSDRTTVAALIEQLGISARVQLVTVNGEPEPDRERTLHHGDKVRIYPFVVGG
jgi:sulfur carrier protein ThiS